VPKASRTDRAAWANAAYDVAWRILHDRDAATAAAVEGVVVEAIADPASAILIATRNRALELLAGDPAPRPSIDESGGVVFALGVDAASDQFAGARQAWGAAEAMGPEDASLVDLHLRFAVPAGTLADDVGTAPEEAVDLLDRLRGRLEGAHASWRIWHDGRPRCEELSAILDEAEIRTFDPITGRQIAKHAVACEVCRATMADTNMSGVEAFTRAPVLRAPAAVHDAVPGTPAEPTAVLPEITPEPEPEPAPEMPDAAATGADFDSDVGGPGLVAGILLGIVIAVIIVAGVTAWVLTSG